MSATAHRFLAVDTSTGDAGLVLAGEGRLTRACLGATDGRARTETLADEAARLLADRGWSPSDLTLLGVVTGPGSYTGLRSGLAFVRGLALPRDLPVVGVGSLELQAWARAGEGERVLALCSAGSGRWACARLERSAGIVLGPPEPALVLDQDLGALLSDGAVAGLAAVLVPAAAEEAIRKAAEGAGLGIRVVARENLEALATAVGAKALRGLALRAGEVVPVYVGAAAAVPAAGLTASAARLE